MRRKDKEITDRKQIEAIMKKATVFRVAFMDGDKPYLVPLCPGYEDGALYFHGFNGGKKLECLEKNPDVAFEFDEDTLVVSDEDACEWTLHYRSVAGTGKAVVLEGSEEKRKGLDVIVRQFAGRTIPFPDEALARVAVVRIDIDHITGRRNGYTD